MFLMRAMERMGLKGFLACGAVLFVCNGLFFIKVSNSVIAKDKARSDAIEKALGPSKEPRTPKWKPRKHGDMPWTTLHGKEKIQRLREERGIPDPNA
jgi:hypothetical protein